MFYSLMDTIKKITIFMVICTAILQLMPGKSYEKYMKPLIGFMLLTRIVISIFSFQSSDVKQEMEDTIIRYENELQSISLQDIKKNEVNVTTQIANKLNDDIINKYSVKEAFIIEEAENSKLVLYMKKVSKEIVIEPIQTLDKTTENEELKKQIADALQMETKSIEVVIVA